MSEDYYIRRKSRIIPGKVLTLYKLEESTDSLLRHRAIELLKNERGMSERQAQAYLRSLEYVPTRGG